jgi:signal transduction histidine kinase
MRILPLLVLGCVAVLCARARAAGTLDVSGELDGIELGRYLMVLEDPGRSLSLEDVRKAELAARFQPAKQAAPSFGYTSSAYWVRLTVDNSSASERPWLLEFAYPHTDALTLFVPDQEGRDYQRRQTGDYLPHASRDVAYRTFVFRLQEPAAGQRTYYMRVVTSSSMLLPLVAWDIPAFFKRQPRELGPLFFFYGVCIAMVVYNVFAFVFIRQTELLIYALHMLATVLTEFALSGHMFELVLPSRPRLAELALVWSFTMFQMTSCYVTDAFLELPTRHPALSRVARRIGHASWLPIPLSLVLTYHGMMTVLFVELAVLTGLACALCVYLFRTRAPRMELFLFAAGVTMLGFIAQVLKTYSVLPTNFWTTWSIHIGSSVQMLVLSSALAEWVHRMRGNLRSLNAELSNKVVALEGALTRAEEATIRAEDATRARDELVATISHELRTPLNAIINVPQGLLRDFRSQRAVACATCKSVFELEEGEQVGAQTVCPECGALALAPHELVRYKGQPARTKQYLAMIERSGKHLLQMVNSILDASKLDAGRLALAVEACDVPSLVSEVIDEMSVYAERAGIQIALHCDPEVGVLDADPLRIKQVLINLLSNAIKFSEGRGPVTVRVRDAGERYEFSVEDRGIGIAPADFERIFSSFEQVHKGNTRKYGGTGLGLSISRSLVRMHGGEIDFRSELGQGTRFFFDIPKGLGARSPYLANDNAIPSLVPAGTVRS